MNEDFERETLDLEMVSEYLDRIEIGRKDPSVEYLSELIYSHQISIPFEDIDVFESKTPSLDLGDIFEKIVRNNRGGYCFEMNGLFCALLNSLGFDAWPCLCKVSMGSNGKHMISHRGTIVSLKEDLYYCDVGFGGPMPRGALLIKNNLCQTIEDEDFTPINMGNGWWQLMHERMNGEKACELMFQTAPADDIDFTPFNRYLSDCDTNSVFRNILIANISTYDGCVSLTNICLKICRNGVVETTTLKSESELRETLEDYFCIKTDTSVMAARLGLAFAESI